MITGVLILSGIILFGEIVYFASLQKSNLMVEDRYKQELKKRMSKERKAILADLSEDKDYQSVKESYEKLKQRLEAEKAKVKELEERLGR